MAAIRRPHGEISAGEGASSVWVGSDHIETSRCAPIDVNLAEITNCFRRALDYALTTEQLGQRAIHDVEAAEGYMEWFYRIFHPRMVLRDMPVPVPRPPEREVLDVRAAQEDGDLAYLQLSGRMSRIKDHIYAIIRSGLAPKETEEWQH